MLPARAQSMSAPSPASAARIPAGTLLPGWPLWTALGGVLLGLYALFIWLSRRPPLSQRRAVVLRLAAGIVYLLVVHSSVSILLPIWYSWPKWYVPVPANPQPQSQIAKFVRVRRAAAARLSCATRALCRSRVVADSQLCARFMATHLKKQTIQTTTQTQDCV